MVRSVNGREMMPSEQIGKYEIEYSGAQLHASTEWGSFVTIYGPSLNPMHRNTIFSPQRVSVDSVFSTQAAAEAEARKVAIAMVK
jgi:hypothetical protein